MKLHEKIWGSLNWCEGASVCGCGVGSVCGCVGGVGVSNGGYLMAVDPVESTRQSWVLPGNRFGRGHYVSS